MPRRRAFIGLFSRISLCLGRSTIAGLGPGGRTCNGHRRRVPRSVRMTMRTTKIAMRMRIARVMIIFLIIPGRVMKSPRGEFDDGAAVESGDVPAAVRRDGIRAESVD